MRRSLLFLSLITILSAINWQPLCADVKLPHVLGSNMVLQRNAEIRIWGFADPREKVTVHFHDETESVRADADGTWKIILPPMKAGGPYKMKVRGKNIIELENILIGDVWICSGQSNMEWNVSSSNNAEEEAENAGYTGIRLFTVPHNFQFRPARDIPSGEWMECNPETILDFSAVGFFFGREIYRENRIPIGLISTNWGGTNIEAWTSGESIGTVEGYAGRLEEMSGMDLEEEIRRREEELRKTLGRYVAEEPGLQEGEALWALQDLDMDGWGSMDLPGFWEEQGMSGFDGIVWFRYEFDLDAATASTGITMHLGMIDDSDLTWVNGYKVGEMTGKYDVKRTYNIPAEYLNEGKNVIAVRVEDTGGGGGFHGSPGDMRLEASGYEKSLAGEWSFRISPAKFSQKGADLIHPNRFPSSLFNGMINPLLNLPVTGAIWYQGEANDYAAWKYRELLPLMISDWRSGWGQPDFPFFIVQLANYKAPPEQPGESTWAELREAQSLALALPNTGLAVTIDIGEADDIHPRNKQDVGKRLALSALKVYYGNDIVHSGPVFREMAIDGSHAVLSFDHVGGGLTCRDRYGYLKGFAIAGEDRVFHWARAHIEDDKVIVYSDQVKEPVAVRYGWADNPDDVNLYNADGLPASPFRTDQWPGITQPK